MTADRLRVLHVIDSLWGGGAEVSTLIYLRHADQDPDIDHRAIILRGDEPTRRAAADLPVAVTLGPPEGRPRWGDARLLRDAIAEFQPHLVHATLFRSTLAAGRATMRSKTPVLVTLTSVSYDVDDLWGSFKRRFGLRLSHWLHGIILRSDRVSVHALTLPVAERAGALFRLDPLKMAVFPYLRPDPLSLVSVDPPEVRRRLGVAAEDPILIYTAREHPVKDHITLLEATARLRRSHPRLRLLLAGPPGTATPAIDDAVARLDLSGTVLRLGQRDDVADLLSASDLFVSTSVSEGLPGAISEAMGAGVPVVAVDNPGVREALGAEHPGLVAQSDIPALAERIDRFLTDDALRAALSQEGRDRFTSLFEVEANLWRYSRLYQQTAHRAPEDRPRGG
jgi:glycosyltransferase involved in cell wall biosynthesis